MRTRVGIGYDSHRFGPGDGIVLGGVRIPAAVRLIGHSDADAVAHAVTDAILGGAGVGDIGTFFPDTDAANTNRNSIEMLRRSVGLVVETGFRPAQVDVTVICEHPKIGPHRDAMRQVLADALGITAGEVMVKGKTNEGMGWIGREEGVAVIAVAQLEAIP